MATVAPPAPFRSTLVAEAGRLGRWLRGLGWIALVGLAGALVRAEAHRPALPDGVEAYTDIVYRRVGDRFERLDMYLPAGGRRRPAVLAIHGGGWRGGSKAGYGLEVAQLAKYGLVVLSIDYRLSGPGDPSWPENFEDVREAVRWVRRHADDYGIDPDRIVAMGASAGGHLAALVGTADDRPGSTSARVQAVINFYGPTDLKAILAETEGAAGPIAMMLGGGPDRVPDRYEAASPARLVSADDPPMLLITGADDRLIPPDQARQLASALEGAGVPRRLIVLPGLGHGFGIQTPGRDLTPELLDFLDEVWNHDGGADGIDDGP